MLQPTLSQTSDKVSEKQTADHVTTDKVVSKHSDAWLTLLKFSLLLFCIRFAACYDTPLHTGMESSFGGVRNLRSHDEKQASPCPA